MNGLQCAYSLLAKYGQGGFNMVLTTSPVPLHASHTGQDVFIANTYSKSVQRAACTEFASSQSNVDYFPSYEAVAIGNPDFVWEDDQRHVRFQAVAGIINHFLEIYAPEKQLDPSPRNLLNKCDQAINALQMQFPDFNIASMIDHLLDLQAKAVSLEKENGQLRSSKENVSKN